MSHQIIPETRVIASNHIDGTLVEENVTYQRTDGKTIELSAAFLDLQDPTVFIIAYEPDDIEGFPSNGVALSMEEARLLRDLLNRPAVAAILDESEDDRLQRSKGFSKAQLDEIARLYGEEEKARAAQALEVQRARCQEHCQD